MYYFLGKMLVLQPDREHTFVKGEPDHPMLAPGPGLYTLREPSLLSSVASGARAKASKLGSEGAAQAAKVSSLSFIARRQTCHFAGFMEHSAGHPADHLCSRTLAADVCTFA